MYVPGQNTRYIDIVIIFQCFFLTPACEKPGKETLMPNGIKFIFNYQGHDYHICVTHIAKNMQ